MRERERERKERGERERERESGRGKFGGRCCEMRIEHIGCPGGTSWPSALHSLAVGEIDWHESDIRLISFYLVPFESIASSLSICPRKQAFSGGQSIVMLVTGKWQKDDEVMGPWLVTRARIPD